LLDDRLNGGGGRRVGPYLQVANLGVDGLQEIVGAGFEYRTQGVLRPLL